MRPERSAHRTSRVVQIRDGSITFLLPACFLTHSGFVWKTSRGVIPSGTSSNPEHSSIGRPMDAVTVTPTCSLARRSFHPGLAGHPWRWPQPLPQRTQTKTCALEYRSSVFVSPPGLRSQPAVRILKRA